MTTKFSRLKWVCACALVLVVSTRNTSAWLRYYAPDDELVHRSDAIVIGHVESGFAPFEQPQGSATEPHWWEYRATLIVTQTLAGNSKVGPMPIIIHYGLRPVLLKDKADIQYTMNPTDADDGTAPTTPVGISEACSWDRGVSDNIRQDHIWFLSSREHASPGPGNEDVSAPGIWSPDDVQSLDREPYFLAVMSGDPKALDPFLNKGDEWRKRNVKVCRARLLVQQIAKDPDLNSRCDQLVAIYVKAGPFSSTAELAMDGIMACGTLGAEKLVPIFADMANHTLDRRSILNAWEGRTWQGLPRGAHFPGASVVITKWLQDEDQWWSTQTAKDRVFAAHDGQKGGDPYNDPRAASFRNIYCAIEALGNVSASKTEPLIRQIRQHWADAAPFDSNNDLLKLCDDIFSSK